MNKLDKYKKIVSELDKLYLSEAMIDDGYRFSIIVTAECNFICFDESKLLFTDTIEKGVGDKETDFNEILEKCKRRHEGYINQLTKFKTK